MANYFPPRYRALYGLRNGDQELIGLAPVFRRGNYIMWAAFNRQHQEIGILVVRRDGKFWPANPATDAGQGMELIRCKLSQTGNHLVAISTPDERRVTDVKSRSKEGDPPTSTCPTKTFTRLRSRARSLRKNRTAGKLVRWEDLTWPMSGRGKDRPTNDEMFCALRAEGWRTIGQNDWTFD